MRWNWIQSQTLTRTTRTPAFWWYPPPPHDYPYYWVILDPKSKEYEVKVTNLKNSPKFHFFFLNFGTNITCDTPSQVAWQDVQIWNGSDKFCWRYRAETILSTDGQTDKVKPVYPPFNFVEVGGITTNLIIMAGCWCLGIDKWFNPTLGNGYIYLCMLRFKLIDVSKKGPCGQTLCCPWHSTDSNSNGQDNGAYIIKVLDISLHRVAVYSVIQCPILLLRFVGDTVQTPIVMDSTMVPTSSRFWTSVYMVWLYIQWYSAPYYYCDLLVTQYRQ